MRRRKLTAREIIFATASVKPAAGFVIGAVGGAWFESNPQGIAAIAPALVSLVLLWSAYATRGTVSLMNLWAWLVLLISCALASRSWREAGIWFPPVEWLGLWPLFLVFKSGAALRMLRSEFRVIRWGACGLVLFCASMAALVFLPVHIALYVAPAFYGGVLLMGLAGAKMSNNLSRSLKNGRTYIRDSIIRDNLECRRRIFDSRTVGDQMDLASG